MPAKNIQSLGGRARAEALSEQQLKESARKAAEARWANRPVKAIRSGNFRDEFGIDVDCYVLDDAQKTAVISQRGVGRALGLPDHGMALPRFLATKSMQEFAGAELREKFTQPLKFQWGIGGAEQPPTVINGYNVTLLIDLCRAIIAAEASGHLGKRSTRVTEQAHVIVSASAKAGITGLVYALSGYSPSAAEVIAAFKLYVQEEARKYEKEFPPELYQEWYRLYDIPVPERGKPWQFKHLTVKHVYYPLAQSSGKILELMRALKARGGDRSMKLFQFLSEIGARALRFHMGRVVEMAESSPDRATYDSKIVRRFGDQLELDFPAT